jgi:glyoxylase-like metal-dependent hydrolase (beta-lactamase superfamily II)
MFEDGAGVSRRRFLTDAGQLGALYAMGGALPFPALALGKMLDNPRIEQTPIVDAGFASVRKIGEGLYATISDTSKGRSTICNGGFLVGKDAALLVEGFATPDGAAFQLNTLRKISSAPAAGALDTHYHYDHTLGNAYYAGSGIQLWAHSAVPGRIVESYAVLQRTERSAFVAPMEKRIADAKTEAAKQHAEGDLMLFGGVFDLVNKAALTLPNRLLDPAQLPLSVDLGHFPIVIESYPGHSGTDLVIRVPDQKVVYAGDLLFSGAYPVTFDPKCTISGWRDTLKTFSTWDKDTIFVPGHGQPCGQEGIQRLRDVFDELVSQAETMYKAGVPVTEAADRYVVPDKFKGVAVFAWGLSITPTFTKLYAEWGGK